MAVDEMRMNPDMMLFQEMVQKITPGDMSKEAEDGLRMVLERLKSGGAMTEKEREMFGSVIGAMPASANMRMRTGAAMSDQEMKRTYMIDGQPMEMATSTYDEAVRLGIITPDTVMENIDGMEIARPPMAPEQSLRPELRPEPMRPRMRPENLGG